MSGSAGGVIGDAYRQFAALNLGWQDSYNPYQTLAAGGIGGVLGGVAGYFDRGLSGLRSGGGLATAAFPEVENAALAWRSLPGGVRIANANGVFVKEVNPAASWFWRWWARTALESQAVGLARLGNLAPKCSYAGGRMITQDVGRYTGGWFPLYLRGSLRLGRPFNDIARRNAGAAGLIFDPTLPPLAELVWSGGTAAVAQYLAWVYVTSQ